MQMQFQIDTTFFAQIAIVNHMLMGCLFIFNRTLMKLYIKKIKTWLVNLQNNVDKSLSELVLQGNVYLPYKIIRDMMI